MHEVGLAFDIVSIVDRYAEEHGVRRVGCVYVTVGEYAGVVPRALELGFAAARDESERCQVADLEIEQVAGRVRCASCGCEFHLSAPGEACPRCSGRDLLILSGKEFKIAAIDHD